MREGDGGGKILYESLERMRHLLLFHSFTHSFIGWLGMEACPAVPVGKVLISVH